MEPANEI